MSVSEGITPTNPGTLRGRPLVLAALALLVFASVAMAWIDPAALCALPALVLTLAMALRPYPGERALTSLRRARRVPRRRIAAAVAGVARCEVVLPRGGLLLARALAVRPPPAAGLPAAA